LILGVKNLNCNSRNGATARTTQTQILCTILKSAIKELKLNYKHKASISFSKRLQFLKHFQNFACFRNSKRGYVKTLIAPKAQITRSQMSLG
jgi:hypothetical protein